MAAKVAVVPRPAPALPPELTGWRHRAGCAGHEETMFPPDGRDTKGRRAWEGQAKEICRPCPVRRPCLAVALFREEEFGVWAGLTSGERRELPWSGGTAEDALAFATWVLGGGGA